MLVTLFGWSHWSNRCNHANAPSPMLVTLSGMVTLVKPVQYINASSPILVTLFPMVTLVKPCTIKCRIPNARNAVGDGHAGQTGAKCKRQFPILVTLFGMVTLVKPLQPSNA